MAGTFQAIGEKVAQEDTSGAEYFRLCIDCGQPDHGTAACATVAQEWFWTPGWQAAEREVEADLAAGQFKTFDTMEEFLASVS